MSIVVAVPESPEGRAALLAGAQEAAAFKTDLVAVNLSLKPLDTAVLPAGVDLTVVDRSGKGDRDPADAVLDEVEAHRAERLVIGVRRRSPVGKAVIGSVSQRLLLDCPVPVVAVKLREADSRS